MVACGMTSLVRGPSGDGGELPNQAIDGLPDKHPALAPLVILLLLYVYRCLSTFFSTFLQLLGA